MARPLADHLTLMDTAHRCGRSPGCRLSAREKTKQASQLQRLLIEDIRHAQGDWIDLAAVLADIEKMTEDLLVSSRLLVPLVFRALQCWDLANRSWLSLRTRSPSS